MNKLYNDEKDISGLHAEIDLFKDNQKHLNDLLKEKDKEITKLKEVIKRKDKQIDINKNCLDMMYGVTNTTLSRLEQGIRYINKHTQSNDFDLLASPKTLITILNGGLEDHD